MIATNIDQSEKLIKLGIDINTADMYWFHVVAGTMVIYEPRAITLMPHANENIHAWSLTALFKMLPYSARLERGSSTVLYCVTLPNELKSSDWYVEPIDAAFEMVCWLLENKKL